MTDLKEIPIPKEIQQILVVATAATSVLALILHIIIVGVHDLGSGDSRNRWGAVSGLGLTATIFVFLLAMVPILANYVRSMGLNERFMQVWRLLLLVGLVLAAAALGALGLLQVSMGAAGVLAFIVDFVLVILLIGIIYGGVDEIVAIERPARPAQGTVSEEEFDSRNSPLRQYEFVIFITGLMLGFLGLAGFLLSVAMKIAHASQQVESNVLLEIFITSMFGALLCVWCGSFEIPNYTRKGSVLSFFWTKIRRPVALMAMLLIGFSLGGFVNAKYPLQNNHWDDAEDVSVVVIIFQFLLLAILSIYAVLCRRKNELESSYEQIP